jgi:hypothetical protein
MSWLSFLLMFFVVQAPASPKARASIRGFVLKIGTGEPVSKAVVTLTRTDSQRRAYAAATGVDGRFTFDDVDPAQYRLDASRSGYVRSEYGARSPNAPGLPITLTAGQRMADVVVQIMAAGTIAGRVFDRNGETLANVNVEALKYSYNDGDRVLNVVQAARTNDLGEYRLFWLQPGQYFVSATYSGGGREVALAGRGVATLAETAGSEEGYIPVYYPGTIDVQSAAPVNLPAGTVFSGLDLTVAAVRTVRIRGRGINGATGQPARNANVSLQPRGRGDTGPRLLQDLRDAAVNDDGAFEIRGVTPGSYELVGVINDGSNRMSGVVSLDVGNSDVQNVMLVISPGFSIVGRVSFEDPSAGNSVARATPMRATLRRVGRQLPFGVGQFTSPVQRDGAFTLQQTGAGDYRMNVAGLPRNAYVKFARLGAADVLSQGLHVERQPNELLEIIIGTDSGSIDGSVTTEKQEPVGNVAVALVPDPAHRNRSDLYRTASTDSFGRFRMEGIPPGVYKLFASYDVESGAWQDPDFLRPFWERGRLIQVGPRASVATEIRVISVN